MRVIDRLLADPETDLKGAIAAIACISAVGIGIGLSFPLLSILLDQRGFSSTVIGANAATAGIASMLAIWLINPIVQWLGVVRSIVVGSLASALSLIGFYFFDSIIMWFVLRFTFHGALSVSFVLSEFWINSSTSDQNRGFMLGIYATFLSLGFGFGPAILAFTGSADIAPFAICVFIFIASILPVLWAAEREPRFDHSQTTSSSFLKFIWLVPLASGAVLVFGAVDQTILSLLPVFGADAGFSEFTISMLLIALAAGNLTFQMPLGLWSDRISDRRKLLLWCGIIGAFGAVLFPLASQSVYTMAALLFLWGGVISGLYTVGLAHLGSRLTGSDLAQANAAFVFCYTLGMIAGPQLTGMMMDWFGYNAMGPTQLVFFVAFVALYWYRTKIFRG